MLQETKTGTPKPILKHGTMSSLQISADSMDSPKRVRFREENEASAIAAAAPVAAIPSTSYIPVANLKVTATAEPIDSASGEITMSTKDSVKTLRYSVIKPELKEGSAASVDNPAKIVSEVGFDTIYRIPSVLIQLFLWNRVQNRWIDTKIF